MRFLYVSDRDQADVEALLRLFELPGDRLLVGVDRAEPVFRGEYVKVALRDAHDQVLLRGRAVGLGLGDDLVRAAQSDDLVPAE